jgi:ubiquinol-cytochrome c reductase cytochrome b subunit
MNPYFMKSHSRFFATDTSVQRYSLLKQPLLNTLNSHLIDYPTPSNLNTSWNGGSLAGILLMAQIITGVCLAMHYTAHVDLAFSSVQHEQPSRAGS